MINQIDNSGRTALYHACAWHNYNAFINIIKFENLNLNLVDVGQNTALHAIVANNERYCDNSIVMINYLLEKSPYMIYQINAQYKTPIGIINQLICPLLEPYISIVPINDPPCIVSRILFEARQKEIELQSQTLILNKNIGLKIIQILKDAHTKWINKPDDNGNTPFHFAVIPRPEFEIWQIIDLVQELTIQQNIRNFKGRTAFHDACFYYKPAVVSILINFSDIDINITDYGGENALHHMIHGYIKNPRNDDCLKAIDLLLKKTPFLVNFKNSAFETPLHYVRLMNKDRGGMIWIMMNGKERKIDCRGIDRKFWATLLTTLEHYQKQARLNIFNYFMVTNNTI